jgi:chromosome segregation ATPase
MNTTELLSSWQRELADDLAAAQTDLATIRAEVDAATNDVSTAEHRHREVAAAIAQIEQPSALITSRLHEFEAARATARGRQARATGAFQNLAIRIKELKLAVRQLDEVLSPAAEDAA